MPHSPRPSSSKTSTESVPWASYTPTPTATTPLNTTPTPSYSTTHSSPSSSKFTRPSTNAEALAAADTFSQAYLSLYERLQTQTALTAQAEADLNIAKQAQQQAEELADRYKLEAQFARQIFEFQKQELENGREWGNEERIRGRKLRKELEKVKKQRDNATVECQRIRKAGRVRVWEL